MLSVCCKAPGTCSLPLLPPYPSWDGATLAFLLFLQLGRVHPTPGPLHSLFLLQGALFPKHLPGLVLSLPSGVASPDHPPKPTVVTLSPLTPSFPSGTHHTTCYSRTCLFWPLSPTGTLLRDLVSEATAMSPGPTAMPVFRADQFLPGE